MFEKTQFRVLKWGAALCGLLVNEFLTTPSLKGSENIEEALDAYRGACHPMLFQTREERMSKEEKAEMVDSCQKWQLLDESKTSVCIEISDWIY